MMNRQQLQKTREMAPMTPNSGMGIGGFACLALIILKVMGEISMSWFAVLTSVIWIPLGILGVVLALFLAGIGVYMIGVLIARGFNKLFGCRRG
jgi:hypothetical protein